MGYAGTGGDSSSGNNYTITILIAMCMGISLYNVLELNILIATTFRKRHSLYFWSFLAATNGIAPHTVGFLLKNLASSKNYILYITLVAIGWVAMVTGQSLVLYSRLHLIFWHKFYLRLVLAMIIINAVVLHIPIIVFMYGSNSSDSNPWVRPYMIYEKIQVTVFFLQELIISAIYIKSCSSFFGTDSIWHRSGVQKMRKHLLLVNVMIILLNIPILALEYTDYYDFQTAYKPLVYSIKLKLEFNILNDLVNLTIGNDRSRSHSQGAASRAAASNINMSAFRGDDAEYRATVHGGRSRGAEQDKSDTRPSVENAIMRSTEISVHCVERRDDDHDSIGSSSVPATEANYATIKRTGGISTTSSEVNLATRGA
ncbi:unnamed protein product [Clonostachys solani]|uniref:DUF7703 domain-containing protein n=1 Tax=Clonostachys solani TaxID=160281 RepID=A0A9N9ZHB6_9HYPO|nr:unnamed protein product [Clonostachys solani]